MENSQSFAGLRLFTVAVMVLLVFSGNLQQTEAQGRGCDAVQISWCLQSFVSNIPPTRECCQKLKSQEGCLCQQTHDSTFGGFLRLPGAKRCAKTCNVTFPDCN